MAPLERPDADDGAGERPDDAGGGPGREPDHDGEVRVLEFNVAAESTFGYSEKSLASVVEAVGPDNAAKIVSGNIKNFLGVE